MQNLVVSRALTTVSLLGCLYLTATTVGIHRGISVFLSLGQGISLFIVPKIRKGNDLQPSPTITPPSLEREYHFRWNVDGDHRQQPFQGVARSFDLGDRILFFQTDQQSAGTYVMDLKRVTDQSVSGVWWYMGGRLPQGTYRGSIGHGDGSIQGNWQSPDGSQRGEWNFYLTAPTDDVDAKTDATEHS